MGFQLDPVVSRPGMNAYVNKREGLIKYEADHQAVFDHVAAKRGESKTPDYHLKLEIPPDVVNSWAQQGYNILEMPSEELRVFLRVHGILGCDYRRIQYD